MKYNGRQLSGPRQKVVPILRPDEEGGNIYFTVKGVSDLSPFDKLCPAPKPPQDMLPGGKFRDNVEDPAYKAQSVTWWNQRSAWIAIQSLRDSPGIEWETVKFDDPSTWIGWTKELMEAGFADGELSRILSAIIEVNGLNESVVEEARKSFLTIQANQGNGSASPKAEASTTPSGTLASNSESDHQDLKTSPAGKT